jgi:membrane protease YdiL (CAAX protease family)
MPLIAQDVTPLWDLAAAAAAGVCLAVWVLIGVRVWQGKSILPYRRRRPVPWRAGDLALVLLIYVLVAAVAQKLVEVILGPQVTRLPAVINPDQINTEHIVARLLAHERGWVLLACGLSAVVLAPIVEEFLFRVVLQGWLEAERRRWRRQMPTLRRLLPGAVGPIVLSSVLFGRLHFRVDEPAAHPDYYVGIMIGNAAAGLLTVVLALVLLRFRAGARAADLGWAREHFFGDVGLGVLAFLAVIVPVYLVQYLLKAYVLPEYLAPDPFTLFLLALVLGTLYHRTHRIVPAVVVHMALNATSTALLLLGR